MYLISPGRGFYKPSFNKTREHEVLFAEVDAADLDHISQEVQFRVVIREQWPRAGVTALTLLDSRRRLGVFSAAAPPCPLRCCPVAPSGGARTAGDPGHQGHFRLCSWLLVTRLSPGRESSQAPSMMPPAVKKRSRRVLVVRGFRFHKVLSYPGSQGGKGGSWLSRTLTLRCR